MAAPPKVPDLLAEFIYRQNPYFLHDRLPHAVAIKSHWLALKNLHGAVDFADIGFSIFSQNNEDGILLYLFSKLGFTTRKSIEIGCNVDNTTIGVPEGNSINLIVNFDFQGLIIDMDSKSIDRLSDFFVRCVTTRSYHVLSSAAKTGRTHLYSPVLAAATISPENVNGVIADKGFGGEIDLLSIDIDGNDVHVWEAITACSPRVLILEVNSRLPFEQPIFAGAVPNGDLDTTTAAYWQSAGSSLSHIVTSVEARGYIFVGMNNNLINAFFVREDAFQDSDLIAVKVSDYFNHRMRPPESRQPR